MTSLEFGEESDVTCERKKLKIAGNFSKNNWKDRLALSCDGENRGNRLYGRWMR